ncbi:MAG: hypothetical protein ACRD4D_05795 [Candidatus Acidiferrales bacterium]
MHYIGQWFLLDKEFVERFAREGVTTESLARLFKAYGVIRNFPGNSSQRLERLVAPLNLYRGRTLDRAEAPGVVEGVVKLMRQLFRREGGFTSAASKVCWMLMRHPIAIYDKRARIGLQRTGMLKRKRGNECADYFQAWQEYSRSVSGLLSETLAWLPRVGLENGLASEFPPGVGTVSQLVGQPWFADRIVDMRLFMKGGNNGDELEMAWMSSLLLAAKLE